MVLLTLFTSDNNSSFRIEQYLLKSIDSSGSVAAADSTDSVSLDVLGDTDSLEDARPTRYPLLSLPLSLAIRSENNACFSWCELNLPILIVYLFLSLREKFLSFLSLKF